MEGAPRPTGGEAPRKDAERQSTFILTRFERWALPRLAASLPRWVVPDHLTALGILAATAVAVAYVLTTKNPHWLWLANGALVVHWFGDSLDGTLARVRKIERPRYGFYLDHLTDAYSTTAIGLGLGFSPYMLLAVGLAIVIGYLVLSINVYLETYVFGEYSFSYGRLGPTEMRVLLIILNSIFFFVGTNEFRLWGVGMTAFDVAGAIIAIGM